MTAMDHVHYLAETIEPRGSTTSQEKEAAQYALKVLSQAKLEPINETFTSARSAWYPYAVFFGLLLAGEFLFWTAGQWGAVIALAERVAKRFPGLHVRPHAFSGAYTEGAIGGKHNFRVLTMVSFRPDGVLPQWHRPTDVVDNVDPEVIEANEAFLWEILHEIDGQGG